MFPPIREYTAEIMFESFNVPGLYIAVQVEQFEISSCEQLVLKKLILKCLGIGIYEITLFRNLL
jgi:hypothetical protein